MLRAAEHGDWAELLPLDGRRLLLMRDTAMPAGEPGAELTRLLRDRLETILNLNERLLALGATRCRDLSHRIHRLSEGRAALRAYAENSD